MSKLDTTPNNSVPTENTEVRKYALLQETSGEESESWYYFIKYNGNEEALAHLQKQLESVDWYILDDLSTFDLESEFLVSEQTAKEMTKVDLNYFAFHRKFDGTLQKIDLGFKPNHSTEKKMSKAFRKLGYGKIENFIDQEDVDPEDMVNASDSSDSTEEEDSEESESSESSSEEEEKKTPKKGGKLPGILSKKPVEMPGFARAKAKRRHNKNKKN